MFRIKLGMTSVFLLRGKEGYLLIDTGYPNKYQNLRAKLLERGIKLEEIRFVLVTHHHYDHTGSLSKILSETKAKLIVHKEGLNFLAEGTMDENFVLLNFRVRLLALLLRTGCTHFEPVAVRENGFVLENDDEWILRNYGIAGKILYTPGHTRDSISVLLDNGTAIVGDLCMNFLKPLGLRKRPMLASDYGEVFKSWQKLLDAGARIIYPAHGEPFAASELIEKMKRFAPE